MSIQTITSALIGRRVEHGGGFGTVADVKPMKAESFTIGASGLVQNESMLSIVWDRGAISEVADQIAAPMLKRAEHLEPVPVEQIPDMLASAESVMAENRAEAARKREAANTRQAEFVEEARARVPAWAKSVIYAELERDDCDPMTDYFNTVTEKRVIIGFSKHTRDLFPEMRNAARNFPQTAHLADAPESAEHREKYSMGAGYYLKAGNRYSSGWKVNKRPIGRGVETLPVASWSLAETQAAPQPVGNAKAAGHGVTIEERTHTKHGFQIWIVCLAARVEREEFLALRDKAKGFGGWYSRKFGDSPAGFAFKNQDSAEVFAGAISSANDSEPQTVESVQSAADSDIAARFRAMADKMQSEIDSKFADRLENTPRRQSMAASARLDGQHLERTQQALRALAYGHESGNLPPELAGLKTKAAIHKATATRVDCSGGYYDAGRDTGAPSQDTPQTRALFSLLSSPDPEKVKARELADKISKLQFANLPGYFPTPAAVVSQMLELADMPDGAFTWLEPSAGSGAILDAMAAAYPDATPVAYELNLTLCEILTAKGYTLTGNNFAKSDTGQKVDRVLMNPPFEEGRDIDHVLRAFEHLKPGGRLVSVMSPGPFFRQNGKAPLFREWFEMLGGKKYDLPANSFKESGTGVATVLVVIDRPNNNS